MTRVAIMCQNMIIGGIQRLIADEARELTRRGVEVWLIVCEPSDPQNTLVGDTGLPAERVVYVPYRRMRNMRSFMSVVRMLWRVRPDVLFTHHWFANTVGRLAALFAGARVVAFEHSVYDAVKSRRQFIFDWVLQFVSVRVVAVSRSVAESLYRHGILRSRVVVIQNGIDLRPYPQGGAREPQEKFTFIFVGRLIGDKGVDVFLDALSEVPGVQARVVGTGPEERVLKEQGTRLGLDDRVQFLGARSDVPALLHTADALVLPSYREGFGLVAIEARAAGLPVILTDFPASTDIIKDGVQGLIVPRGDVQALAGALRRLSQDRELYARLAASAPQGLDRFSIERHVDELMAFAREPIVRYS
jgi:glycosyltransferase involved in cell wall biosynthesis